MSTLSGVIGSLTNTFKRKYYEGGFWWLGRFNLFSDVPKVTTAHTILATRFPKGPKKFKPKDQGQREHIKFCLLAHP